MELSETIERAMASATPFGDDSHILDQMRDRLIQQLEQLAPDLPAAGELLDAVAHSSPGDHRRLITETTLRCAIGHAHKHLTSGAPRGPRLLRLTDCAAILRTAARYVEQGGTDTPLQDGSLVRLGPTPRHGWIWRDEHPNDAYGVALRELVIERYGTVPSAPDAGSIALLQSGARLLDELLPSLAASALPHAHVVACLPASRMFTGSASRSDLAGMFFVRESLGSPWWIAEHLLHESIHLKLYDLVAGQSLAQSGVRTLSIPVVIPWRPSRLCGGDRFDARRVLAAFHVYVHLALLSTVAESRAPELEATYGPLSGMIESCRARARARYLGRQLRAHPLCWGDLDAIRQELADWLHSLLEILDPAGPLDGSIVHLHLDLYHKETDQVEEALAEPTQHLGARSQELTALARQDVASTRAILSDLDADRQLAKLETAVARFTDAELADSYPEIRRIVEACLFDASPDGHWMSKSGMHEAMVGEMVHSASDALFALSAGIPAPVAHAKRRAVENRITRSCDDRVGRLLAAQAAHLPLGAKVVEIGTGVGIATAWLVSGLGSRTDVDILSVEVDETYNGIAREYDWPSYVRIETADARTALADHPTTFDLVLAGASVSTLDYVDAMVGASRSGGMLIFFHHTGVGAAAGEPEGTPITALRQTVLAHDELVGVDIDWSGGLLIAVKRQ